MKQTVKITLCAMVAALSVVFMLLSYFPAVTYAVPAVTGLLIMIPVIEINKRWAFGAYAAASVLIFLTGEPESKLLYICFFGFYPIVKALIEQWKKPLPEWGCKLLVFNVSMLTVYGLFAALFGISTEDFGSFGKYGAMLFLAFGNVIFVLYDIAVSRMAGLYFRIRPAFSRFLK